MNDKLDTICQRLGSEKALLLCPEERRFEIIDNPFEGSYPTINLPEDSEQLDN